MSGPCRRDIAANQGERDDEEDQGLIRALLPEFDVMVAQIERGKMPIDQSKTQLARSEYKRG